MVRQLKVPKTEAEYRTALRWFEELLNGAPESLEAETLEVLSLVIEKYEEEHYPIDLPNPVAAIRFRMEQQDLMQKDLVPFIGSRSKVSEVLSGKRELTLTMMRALHEHLEISAEVLLKQPKASLPDEHDLKFGRFPVSEMQKNGAFAEISPVEVKDRAEDLIRRLIDRAGGFSGIPVVAYRKTDGMRINAGLDHYALLGWSLQVLAEAAEVKPHVSFDRSTMTDSFLESLAGLSVFPEGPRLARELLATHGIILHVVPHLAKTYLDGALFVQPDGTPVVGVTGRHDRVDNFWFVLMHELGHLLLDHLSEECRFFADNIDLRARGGYQAVEQEADTFASDVLLPLDFDLDQRLVVSTQEVIAYARRVNRHPAIVAGRIQYARNNYRVFSRLVGRGEVGRCFQR